MKRIFLFITLVGFIFLLVNCQQTPSTKPSTATTAVVRYATGLSIQKQKSNRSVYTTSLLKYRDIVIKNEKKTKK
jgi:hypothetical protein